MDTPPQTCPLHEMAQMIRDHIADPSIEVEFRLGTNKEGRWSSNIGFAYQDKIISQSGSVDNPKNGGLSFTRWSERCDHYHNGMRTRLLYDGEDCKVIIDHIRKEKIVRAQLDVDKTELAIRLDISRETKVSACDVPNTAITDSVHIVHFCSADYTSKHGGQRMWRYDMSIRWSGATRSEAESRQRSSDYTPEYSIELEYIGTPDMVEQYGAQRLVVSAIAKLMDIVDCREHPIKNFQVTGFGQHHS